MYAQEPAARWAAWRAVARCVLVSGWLLARGRVRLEGERIGLRLHFADGTSGVVYRETRMANRIPADPCALVVMFRLRGVRGFGHRLFRWESLLNTPLFVGFPGFASKLWVAADGDGRYRGVYEWDGPELAVGYARSLWRVLALVSERGSIRYTVLPGLHRDDLLALPGEPGAGRRQPEGGWWRVVDVT